VDDLLNCPFLGRQAPAITRPAGWGYRRQTIDGYTADGDAEGQNAAFPDHQNRCPTLLQLFVRSVPFRGSAGLTSWARDWFKFLVETDQLQALVLYGSPYVLADLLPLLPPRIPYVFTYGQMPAAQAIALEALVNANDTQGQHSAQEQGDREFTD
jgi:beta-glucosidase